MYNTFETEVSISLQTDETHDEISRLVIGPNIDKHTTGDFSHQQMIIFTSISNIFSEKETDSFFYLVKE